MEFEFKKQTISVTRLYQGLALDSWPFSTIYRQHYLAATFCVRLSRHESKQCARAQLTLRTIFLFSVGLKKLVKLEKIKIQLKS